MTYLQFKYYLNNEDFSSISYRKFNKEEKDEYPNFSICFSGSKIRGEIFKLSHDVFHSTNITRASYGKYLGGDLESHSRQFSTIKFDDVTINIRDIALYQKSGHSLSWWGVSKLAMIPTFRDSQNVCFSKVMAYKKDKKQNFDDVYLNSSMMYEDELDVKIYVHEKGQLMRRLKMHSSFFRPKKEFKDGMDSLFILINVGQVDILRKRENSKIPCDKHMKDEDAYILRQIMINSGCIPTYWEQFAGSIELNKTTSMCKSRNDYKKIANQIWKALDRLAKMDSIYNQPCTEMIVSVTTKENEYLSKPGRLELRFVYPHYLYREITHTRAYTSETLLGQIGGFVGMKYEFMVLIDIVNVFI